MAYATHTQGLKALFEPQGHVEGKKHAKEACGDRASGCLGQLTASRLPDLGSLEFCIDCVHVFFE